MSVTAIVNAEFFTGDSVLSDRALLFDDRAIIGFVDTDAIPSGAATINAGGCRVCPGLIDLQVNGSGAFNASIIEHAADLKSLGDELARTGTTRWAPTVLSRSMDRSMAIAELAAPIAAETGIIAIHIEGPWLNPEKAGAHVLTRLVAPSEADIATVDRIAALLPTIVTLAPECVPDALLEQLTGNRRIRVMLAHSTADFDATARFLDGGGAGITHVFNTMHGVASRAPGPVAALVARPGKHASVITDGVHIHPATVALLKRAADPGALFIVSDLIWDAFIDQSAHDGVLAGSRLSLREMVAYCVNAVGIPFDEALRMATLYPARFLGLEDRFGKLAAGCMPDIFGLSDDFDVRFVVRNGRIITSGTHVG